MLQKENRLLTNYQFRTTHRYGKKISSRLFYIYYLKRTDGDSVPPTKVGIVVSKKLSNIAVKRNKLKRIFREIVRKNFDKIQSGYWIVIHPKKESQKATYEEINTEFNKILQKVPFSEKL